jgi:hypothetical protein
MVMVLFKANSVIPPLVNLSSLFGEGRRLEAEIKARLGALT